MSPKQVVGRYAPSPTGEQHLGNLRTAVFAWLQARVQGGRFIVRMEDLDQLRVVKGSAKQILGDLESLGIDWDGAVEYQSQRLDLYQQGLTKLAKADLVYPCFCSRKELQSIASAPHSKGVVYPGICAGLSTSEVAEKTLVKEPAVRVRVQDKEIGFIDAIHGEVVENLSTSIGDFVVKRADGLFAYQLAVVVDDIEQGITDVVRGDDLLSSTARQIYLARLLAPQRAELAYTHVPLMRDELGNRMAKRYGSCSLQHWLSQGKSINALIATFAQGLGIASDVPELSAIELLNYVSQLTFNELASIGLLNSDQALRDKGS